MYSGALLGVRAHVALGHERDYADVELVGVPLGGTLRGLLVGPDGAPVLDARLERAMRRRCCAIGGGADRGRRDAAR